MATNERAALLLLLLAGTSTIAKTPEQELPPSGLIYGERDLSKISFDCLFLDADEHATLAATGVVRCRFTQVVLQMPKPGEVERKVADSDASFDKEWTAALVKGEAPAAEIRKLCAPSKDLDKAKKYQEQEMRRLSKNDYGAFFVDDGKAAKDVLATICACKADADCLRAALKAVQLQGARSDAEACRLYQFGWSTIFKRSGSNWLAVEGPGGCWASCTTSLTKTAEGFWSMRTVRVPAPQKPIGPNEIEFCPNKLEDETDTSKVFPTINLPCKTLKF